MEEILSGAHSQGVDAGVVAEEGVLRAYRAATGQAAADGGAAAGSSVNNRKPVEGDCPICFNELKVRAQHVAAAHSRGFHTCLVLVCACSSGFQVCLVWHAPTSTASAGAAMSSTPGFWSALALAGHAQPLHL